MALASFCEYSSISISAIRLKYDLAIKLFYYLVACSCHNSKTMENFLKFLKQNIPRGRVHILLNLYFTVQVRAVLTLYLTALPRSSTSAAMSSMRGLDLLTSMTSLFWQKLSIQMVLFVGLIPSLDCVGEFENRTCFI